MPYYHIHVVVQNGANEYFEHDQTKESVEKLYGLFSLGHRFPVSGVLVDPAEVNKFRIFRTNLRNKEIMGARVWDVGEDVTTEFVQSPAGPKHAHSSTMEDAANKIKVLFLAANPKDTVRLRLDEEFREIENQILRAQKKDKFNLVNRGAVRTNDLQFYLNQEQPDIVHFSGHGTEEGQIVMENEEGYAKPVPPNALTRVFETLKDNIRVVVLNACFSSDQAQAISEHIDCVIGMSEEINDKAAISFSSAFYLAIASGRNIKNAFDQGINDLMLKGITNEHTPQLLTRNSLDPSKIHLLDVGEAVQKGGIPSIPETVIEYIEGIQAYLFFPEGTPGKHKNLDHHGRNLHHRLVVNFKTRPPKAYYLTPDSFGWRFIEKYPDRWISEIVTTFPYSTDNPDFTRFWCLMKQFELKPWVAEKKDLLES